MMQTPALTVSSFITAAPLSVTDSVDKFYRYAFRFYCFEQEIFDDKCLHYKPAKLPKPIERRHSKTVAPIRRQRFALCNQFGAGTAPQNFLNQVS